MGIDEVAAFSKAVTKQRIASICLALGWNSVGTLSMEILQVWSLTQLGFACFHWSIFTTSFAKTQKVNYFGPRTLIYFGIWKTEVSRFIRLCPSPQKGPLNRNIAVNRIIHIWFDHFCRQTGKKSPLYRDNLLNQSPLNRDTTVNVMQIL